MGLIYLSQNKDKDGCRREWEEKLQKQLAR